MSSVPVGEPTIVGAAWRYRLIVVIPLILGLVTALAYLRSRPQQFTAAAGLVLEDPRTVPVFGTAFNQAPDRYVGDQIAVLKSADVDRAASRAAARQKPPLQIPADYFFSHTTITGTQRTGSYVEVGFVATDRNTALGGVDALVTGYEDVVHASVAARVTAVLAEIDATTASIDGNLTAIQNQLAATKAGAAQQSLLTQQQTLLARRTLLVDKRDQVTVDAARQTTGVATYLKAQKAVRGSRLISGAPIIALASVSGLLVGLACAYALARRRKVFSRPEEPEAMTGVPLIASIPRLPSPSAVGIFQTAALLVRSLKPEQAAQVIAITSAHRQQGRSTVAGNLALSLVADGLRVLVIDADPSQGGVADYLTKQFGASIVENGADDGVDFYALPGSAVERISLVNGASGELVLVRPSRGYQLASSEATAERYSRITADFDVVLIDAPPAGELAPHLALIRPAQAILVVSNNEAIASVQETHRLLRILGLPVIGYVYTNPRPRRDAARRDSQLTARSVTPELGAPAPPAKRGHNRGGGRSRKGRPANRSLTR